MALSLHRGRVAPPANPQLRLAGLNDQLRKCHRCQLSRGRKSMVFGRGSPTALVMLVFSRPGYFEDKTGLPIAGETAANLVMIAAQAAGLILQQDCYATYIAKCITPKREDGFREPLPDEAAGCRPFFDEEVKAVKPAFIVAMGKEANALLFRDERSFNAYSGHFRTYGPECIGMSTHNPAGLFGERERLIPEFMDHWRKLGERVRGVGRMYRPDAAIYKEGRCR